MVGRITPVITLAAETAKIADSSVYKNWQECVVSAAISFDGTYFPAITKKDCSAKTVARDKPSKYGSIHWCFIILHYCTLLVSDCILWGGF